MEELGSPPNAYWASLFLQHKVTLGPVNHTASNTPMGDEREAYSQTETERRRDRDREKERQRERQRQKDRQTDRVAMLRSGQLLIVNIKYRLLLDGSVTSE